MIFTHYLPLNEINFTISTISTCQALPTFWGVGQATVQSLKTQISEIQVWDDEKRGGKVHSGVLT